MSSFERQYGDLQVALQEGDIWFELLMFRVILAMGSGKDHRGEGLMLVLRAIVGYRLIAQSRAGSCRTHMASKYSAMLTIEQDEC
jgi:hypothetical protein